jgi:hydroxylamine reductase
MITYSFKGISAYAHHAAELGYFPRRVAEGLVRILAATTDCRDVPTLLGLAMDTGQVMMHAMEDLDTANAAVYGNPEITTFSIDVGTKPGILVTGHDLIDIEQLLEQTDGQGVDVYTHSEMIAAHYYPKLKRFAHLRANYGNSWWRQDTEFASFNGPILVTTNCIVPVQESYKNRIFTTGCAGYPGVPHLTERRADGKKDFSRLIALAKTCPPPKAIDHGTAVGGFNHRRLVENADKVLDLVKRGKIKRFIVMGGCDGRDLRRDYYRDVARALPKEAVILTAGCAKYMYYKLGLGDIEGLPRVLEAGQCNDCYSLVAFALKVKNVLGLKDINELPISYDIAWYDQKAVGILLTLLSLGVKGIRLGPTLPAFVSPNILKVLVEKFDLKPIGTASGDVEAMMGGH